MRFLFFFCCLLCSLPSLHAQTISSQENGYASYIANNLDGRRTAYGEIYNKNKLTAAHRTYPLGTLVKVTRQDNGKSIIVRINDKGPFGQTRLIDVSYAAAEVLDLVYDGIAMVKTQVVDAEGKPVQLPSVTSAASQAPTAYDQIEVPISYDYKPQFIQPENTTARSIPATTIPPVGTLPASPYQTDLQPKTPLPVDQPAAYGPLAGGRISTAPVTGYFVQIGAFSKRANAESLLNTLSNKGFNNAQIKESGQFFKMLVGPYLNEVEANQGKNKITQEMKLQGFVTEIK